MTPHSDLGVVLALLREDDLQPDGGLLVRGGETIPAERREAVVAHVRENAEAQLTLFLLAVELKATGAAGEEQLLAELRAFVDAVRERFDVDLLETAAAHRHCLPPSVPAGLLDGGRAADGDR